MLLKRVKQSLFEKNKTKCELPTKGSYHEKNI